MTINILKNKRVLKVNEGGSIKFNRGEETSNSVYSSSIVPVISRRGRQFPFRQTSALMCIMGWFWTASNAANDSVPAGNAPHNSPAIGGVPNFIIFEQKYIGHTIPEAIMIHD
jgi:hypothetical protein